jgi:hypothetical protein
MRNPLNSIVNLTIDLQDKIKDLEEIIKQVDGDEVDGYIRQLILDFMKDLQINCQR